MKDMHSFREVYPELWAPNGYTRNSNKFEQFQTTKNFILLI